MRGEGREEGRERREERREGEGGREGRGRGERGEREERERRERRERREERGEEEIDESNHTRFGLDIFVMWFGKKANYELIMNVIIGKYLLCFRVFYIYKLQ
jgi:hypothetical protein